MNKSEEGVIFQPESGLWLQFDRLAAAALARFVAEWRDGVVDGSEDGEQSIQLECCPGVGGGAERIDISWCVGEEGERDGLLIERLVYSDATLRWIVLPESLIYFHEEGLRQVQAKMEKDLLKLPENTSDLPLTKAVESWPVACVRIRGDDFSDVDIRSESFRKFVAMAMLRCSNESVFCPESLYQLMSPVVGGTGERWDITRHGAGLDVGQMIFSQSDECWVEAMSFFVSSREIRDVKEEMFAGRLPKFTLPEETRDPFLSLAKAIRDWPIARGDSVIEIESGDD